MARNFLTSRESGGVLAVAQENSEDSKSSKSQTAHRLMMSPTTFKSLSLAIHNLSVRELELCSPRRLLTSVLEDGDGPLLQLSVNELDAVCRAEILTGRVKVNIRVDSSVNDRIRISRVCPATTGPSGQRD
jgi:hypothetical protein